MSVSGAERLRVWRSKGYDPMTGLLRRSLCLANRPKNCRLGPCRPASERRDRVGLTTAQWVMGWKPVLDVQAMRDACSRAERREEWNSPDLFKKRWLASRWEYPFEVEARRERARVALIEDEILRPFREEEAADRARACEACTSEHLRRALWRLDNLIRLKTGKPARTRGLPRPVHF